jgi:hypothetical protein
MTIYTILLAVRHQLGCPMLQQHIVTAMSYVDYYLFIFLSTLRTMHRVGIWRNLEVVRYFLDLACSWELPLIDYTATVLPAVTPWQINLPFTFTFRSKGCRTESCM